MFTGISIPQDVSSSFRPFGPMVLSPNILSNETLLWTVFPFGKAIINVTRFPEDTTKWILSLLDLFAGIVNRNEDLSQIEVSESEYHQLLGFLDDLVFGVGEDENHPLTTAMTLVGVLIKVYEDQHFPKMSDLFPDLANNLLVEGNVNQEYSCPTQSERISTLFTNAFYTIGCLLWIGGVEDEAISAFDLAVDIGVENASIHAIRGEVKCGLNDLDGAKADLHNALKISEKQREDNLSTLIEERLQEFELIETVIEYFSKPMFAKFSILRECEIQLGTFRSRADIVLCDAQENFIVITECKLQDGTDSTEPLKSYLCATDTKFGLFASNIDPDSWVFYENLRHNRFQQITRADFEEQVLANS